MHKKLDIILFGIYVEYYFLPWLSIIGFFLFHHISRDFLPEFFIPKLATRIAQ